LTEKQEEWDANIQVYPRLTAVPNYAKTEGLSLLREAEESGLSAGPSACYLQLLWKAG